MALVHPALARDRYRVDVVLDPSRFLLELPTDRLESVSVRPALEGPTATALPEARYELPAFLESGNGTDGDVN